MQLGKQIPTGINHTWLDGSEHIPEVKARRDQILKHIDEVQWRHLRDGVASVHCTHYIDTTVLVHTDQHTSCA